MYVSLIKNGNLLSSPFDSFCLHILLYPAFVRAFFFIFLFYKTEAAHFVIYVLNNIVLCGKKPPYPGMKCDRFQFEWKLSAALLDTGGCSNIS